METAARDTVEFKTGVAGKEQVNHLKGGHSQDHKGYSQRQSKQNPQVTKKYGKCWRCGNSNHSAQDCRFKTESCRKCNRQGHIVRVCDAVAKFAQGQKKSQNQTVRQMNVTESENIDEDFSLYSVNKDVSQAFKIPVVIDKISMEMELDTGAAVSVMSSRDFHEHFDKLKLKKTDITLTTYTGERIYPEGVATVEVQYKQQRKMLPLVVVQKGGPPLMGRDWLNEIQLDWSQIKTLNKVTGDQQAKLKEILDRHPDIFKEELGTIKDIRAKLTLKPGATPKFMKARPVPFSLKPLVEVELDRLVKLGVLTPISTSEWATPIVPVVKKDGTIRICGDYKVTLNPLLEVEKYPLPKVEEMFASLAGGQKFSKLDLSQAYQQILMEDESKEYLTLNTHKGLFQVNRLSFGVASAPSIFQRCMDQILQGLSGIMGYLDDILTTGASDETHFENLDKVLTRMEDFGIRLKDTKCDFFKDTIEYLGHTISAKGLQASLTKVEAIASAPDPENVTQLRSFLGMINYYRKFLPNLSSVLQPLHELLDANSEWVWSKRQAEAVEQVKTLLTSDKVLTHFDPTLPLSLACDASAYGVGAVLAHIGKDGMDRPIAFASRTLTKAEKGYAQIEKEGLSLIFGIRKFHQYLYGQKFTLITDHLPLLKIFGPKEGIPSLAAARMQRWALLLAAHNYEICYRKSQAHANADGLSRLPLEKSDCLDDNTVEIFNMSQIGVMPITHQELAKETKLDPVLSQVLLQTTMGWTKTSDIRLQPFYIRRHELTIQNGCVLWGIRVVIPLSLQELVLREIHSGHLGIVRMKSVARSYTWWPSMDSEIEKTVAQCPDCQVLRKEPAKAVLHPWSFPEGPWQRLHIDFAGPFLGENFLVIVDASSKWPEIFIVPNLTATKTVECLRSVFSRFGLPEQVVSDNGATFTSEEFKVFLQQNGVKHICSAPYHPSTNGQAERFVQTFKRGLKPVGQGRTLPQRLAEFLLTYRSTPQVTTGQTPAYLLMKKQLRTSFDLLRPSVECKVRQSQAKQVFARRKTGERYFSTGDTVLVRDYRSRDKWIQGTLIEQTGPVSYKVQVSPGVHWRRHQDQILNSVPDSQAEAFPNDSSELLTDSGVITEQPDMESVEHTGELDSKLRPELVSSPQGISKPISSPETATPRYPSRNRRAPVRLDL